MKTKQHWLLFAGALALWLVLPAAASATAGGNGLPGVNNVINMALWSVRGLGVLIVIAGIVKAAATVATQGASHGVANGAMNVVIAGFIVGALPSLLTSWFNLQGALVP